LIVKIHHKKAALRRNDYLFGISKLERALPDVLVGFFF